jgi:hypothetical protein
MITGMKQGGERSCSKDKTYKTNSPEEKGSNSGMFDGHFTATGGSAGKQSPNLSKLF